MNRVRSQCNIVLFRNDLRLRDNIALSTARRSGFPTLCLYCFDPRMFTRTEWGSIKTDRFKAQFIVESVQNLRVNLERVSNSLLILHTAPEDAISTLLRVSEEISVKMTLFMQEEVTYEEKQVERNIKRLLKSTPHEINLLNGATLYDPSTLPFRADLSGMPNTYTVFRQKIEKEASFRSLYPDLSVGSLPVWSSDWASVLVRDLSQHKTVGGFEYLPTLATLYSPLSDSDTISSSAAPGIHSDMDPRAVMRFVGGEDSGQERLNQWMFAEDRLREYFDIRNGMIGSGYSSKFSPWLALGCISARYAFLFCFYRAIDGFHKLYLMYSYCRQIAEEVKRYETERGVANKSTYWMIFELICREYFRCLCMKYGNGIFQWKGPIAYASTSHSASLIKYERRTLSGLACAPSYPSSWGREGSREQQQRAAAWKQGRTGVPIVDANMRELNMTGWMSNRGRQIVASYLIHELKVYIRCLYDSLYTHPYDRSTNRSMPLCLLLPW